MNQKLLNFLALLSPLACYLEWGDHKMFLAEIEYDLFTLYDSFSVLTHPAVCLPFIGQLLLAFTLFQKTPSRKITVWGIGLLGLLVVLIFLGGIVSFNAKIAVSALPFFIIGFLCIRNFKTKRAA